MLIYNVTISIDQTVEIEWLNWMKTQHIQQVIDTGCFTGARFTRVTSHSQPDCTSYSVQYFCENHELLKDYKENYAPQLREDGMKLFGDKMHVFRTELELIGDFFGNRS